MSITTLPQSVNWCLCRVFSPDNTIICRNHTVTITYKLTIDRLDHIIVIQDNQRSSSNPISNQKGDNMASDTEWHSIDSYIDSNLTGNLEDESIQAAEQTNNTVNYEFNAQSINYVIIIENN